MLQTLVRFHQACRHMGSPPLIHAPPFSSRSQEPFGSQSSHSQRNGFSADPSPFGDDFQRIPLRHSVQDRFIRDLPIRGTPAGLRTRESDTLPPQPLEPSPDPPRVDPGQRGDLSHRQRNQGQRNEPLIAELLPRVAPPPRQGSRPGSR